MTVNFPEAFRQITTYGTLLSLPVLRETDEGCYEVVEGHVQVEVWGEFHTRARDNSGFEQIPAVVVDRNGVVTHAFQLVNFACLQAPAPTPLQQSDATSAPAPAPAPQPNYTSMNAKQLRKAAADLQIDVTHVNFRSSKQRQQLRNRLQASVKRTATPKIAVELDEDVLREKGAETVERLLQVGKVNSKAHAQKLVDKSIRLILQHEFDAARRILAPYAA